MTNEERSAQKVEQSKQEAKQSAEKLKQEAQTAAEQGKEHIRQRAEHGKGVAAERIEGVADGFRASSQALRDQGEHMVADYVERISDGIAETADNIRHKDMVELMDDARRIARRNPALFLGSAFTLGFALSRFFKSSSREAYYRDDFSDYGRQSGISSRSSYPHGRSTDSSGVYGAYHTDAPSASGPGRSADYGPAADFGQPGTAQEADTETNS